MNLSPSPVFFVFFLLSLLDYEVVGSNDILHEENEEVFEFTELENLFNEMLDEIALLQGSAKCYSDDVCGTGHCLLQNQDDKDGKGPSINYCYECVNNQDCDETEECTMSDSKTDLECTTRRLRALPSIRSVLNGYNLYKGDPLLITEDISNVKYECVTNNDCASNEFCNYYDNKCDKDNGAGWQTGKAIHIESRKFRNEFLAPSGDGQISLCTSCPQHATWVPKSIRTSNGFWTLESVLFPNQILMYKKNDKYLMSDKGTENPPDNALWFYYPIEHDGRYQYSIASFINEYIDAGSDHKPYVKDSAPNKYDYRYWHFTKTNFW